MIVVVKGFAKVSKKGSTIIVSTPRKTSDGGVVWETRSVPLLDLELVVIVGSRVSLSSGVITSLSEVGVPLLIHSRRADSVLINPFDVRVAEVRRKLYNLIDNPSWRISVGRAFIEGKILGMVSVVRYFTYKATERGEDVKWVLEEVRTIEENSAVDLRNSRSVDELRLCEAKWSKRLWELLGLYIPKEYEFTGRNPKSRDPINSAINYVYAVLYSLCTHALIASGLDPYVGIVHSERAGKTSLTYDFSEMFKPIAAHVVTVVSRTAKISVDPKGYLNLDSLGVVTRALYKTLKRKQERGQRTLRECIYAKAWELRQSIERAKKFEPFVYRVK
jgi:CRISPR-associated protein Cas1